MQVEDKEINGFLIESFNQHGLEVGKTQGICPLCSSSRKPENRKAKCVSYDWERGLGTSHNCHKTFQLHTYKRKSKALISKISSIHRKNIIHGVSHTMYYFCIWKMIKFPM